MKIFLIKEILVACLLPLSIFFICNIVLAEEAITEDLINITDVTMDEFAQIPYLTEELAEEIIAYRDDYGIGQWADLFDVDGVDADLLDKIKRDFYIGKLPDGCTC